MKLNSEILPPFKFNAHKHHWLFFIDFFRNSDENQLINLLESWCNNYIDFYTGNLTPERICDELANILKLNNCFNSNDFNNWLKLNSGYKRITISDLSQWILRMGVDPVRYIHLHPSRKGANIVRFKGSTLKTALAVAQLLIETQGELNLDNINKARIKTGLSPLKNVQKSKGLVKCLDFICGYKI